MYLFVNDLGEILRGSHEEVSDIEVDNQLFHTYPSFCWSVRDGVVSLKDDADTILETHLAQEKATNLQILEDEGFKQLREQRNRLLAETDWTASTDVTMTAEMTEYRQALRDLPANTTDIFNPIYPEKP